MHPSGRVDDLVGTPWTCVIRSAVVVGAKVDCLAAKGAAVVDKRLMLLDGHGDKGEMMIVS